MKHIDKRLSKLLALVFWVIVWQIVSMLVNKTVLIASPADTAVAFIVMLRDGTLISALLGSLGRITAGFVLGTAIAVLCTVAAYRWRTAEMLLSPLIHAVRSAPVASFTVILLIWIGTGMLTTVISMLMVWPVMYSALLEGLRHRDESLLEMAQVFSVSKISRFYRITLYGLIPYIRTAVETSVGLSWKAGIAAEVIGQPNGSVGTALYMSKVYLATPELFAWTFCVIAVSMLMEKAVIKLFDILNGGLRKR